MAKVTVRVKQEDGAFELVDLTGTEATLVAALDALNNLSGPAGMIAAMSGINPAVMLGATVKNDYGEDVVEEVTELFGKIHFPFKLGPTLFGVQSDIDNAGENLNRDEVCEKVEAEYQRWIGGQNIVIGEGDFDEIFKWMEEERKVEDE